MPVQIPIRLVQNAFVSRMNPNKYNITQEGVPPTFHFICWGGQSPKMQKKKERKKNKDNFFSQSVLGSPKLQIFFQTFSPRLLGKGGGADSRGGGVFRRMPCSSGTAFQFLLLATAD